jgi:hypothetical protein
MTWWKQLRRKVSWDFCWFRGIACITVRKEQKRFVCPFRWFFNQCNHLHHSKMLLFLFHVPVVLNFLWLFLICHMQSEWNALFNAKNIRDVMEHLEVEFYGGIWRLIVVWNALFPMITHCQRGLHVNNNKLWSFRMNDHEWISKRWD